MRFHYAIGVIFILIASFYVFVSHRLLNSIFQYVDVGLQSTIDYLTYLHLNIQQNLSPSPIQLNFHTDHYETEDIDNSYNISNYEQQCPQHRYTIRIIEKNPLVIYIENFLTEFEIQHIIELTEPVFRPSTFYDDDGKPSYGQYRTSSTTTIKRHRTPVIKCIEQRFAQFQGNIDIDRIEPLQVVKYTHEQQFKAHYDWFSQGDLTENGGQRISTFFTYLRANCTLGETEFLDIPFNLSLHERFCDILICDAKSLESDIRFRPIVSNSVFWFNVDEQGEVDYLTYHAGRPPGENGQKIGLNTWTHEHIFSPSSKNA
ncbi:unnamed protein product [Adineta ricciae]|uniref:Prolyl 4-hydroxylase alpha subunit domain-containing protein n=1 Tax=Adineta ricciae TaxID=249248 RepID=A0A813P6S2_ADIRI|nr:unnamed protein product [Adineta ricciae]